MIRWNEEEFPTAASQTNDSLSSEDSFRETETFETAFAEETLVKSDKPRCFPAVFLYQTALSIGIAILMVVLNTFYPNIYWNIDRYLKPELMQQVDFRKDGEETMKQIQSAISKLKPEISETQNRAEENSEMVSQEKTESAIISGESE